MTSNSSSPILTEFWHCPVSDSVISPADYLRTMQEVGEAHLTACGYPMKNMLSRGESMMLARSAIRILLPNTSPDRAVTRQFAQHGVRASRVFEFYSGNLLTAEAINEYFCISLATRRIFRPVWLTGSGTPYTPQFVALERLKLPPEGGTECGVCSVTSDMIDFNGHVNNACYAEFAMAALQTSVIPSALHLHYEHELLPESEFTLYRLENTVWGIQQDRIVFIARFDFNR